MSNLVLYRKYRPQTFKEVVGQEHVKTTLLNAVKEGKTAHAYLFCGPRGCGKTTVARILSKAVNCEDKKSPEPCNKCLSCKEIINNQSMDIIEIDAASHRGIDEIREICEGVRFGPNRGNYKVFILDEAHQLTSGAVNALLKTLEEAPSHVIFILATTEAQKMIATVISRCQRFDFKKITVPEIVTRLKDLSEKEGLEAEEDALKIIAGAAGGALRDAEGLLSQVISFTKKGEVIGKEEVKSLLGLIERDIITSFISAILKKQPIEGLRIIDEALSQGVSAEAFYENIMHYLREMIVVKVLTDEGKLQECKSVIENLLTKLTEEELEVLEKQTKDLSVGKIKYMIDCFYSAGERIKSSPIPQLPLETALGETIEGLSKR